MCRGQIQYTRFPSIHTSPSICLSPFPFCHLALCWLTKVKRTWSAVIQLCLEVSPYVQVQIDSSLYGCSVSKSIFTSLRTKGHFL